MGTLRNHGTLLLVAVLGGISTAAGFVMIQALRLPSVASAAENAPASPPAARYAKPSVFGTAPIASPIAAKQTPAQIAEAGAASLVTVVGYGPDDQPVAQGVGWIYTPTGMIVTSYSAIRGASNVSIETAKGDELNVIALMGYNVAQNLAILAVLEGSLPALESGPGDPVQEGGSALTFGPHGSSVPAKVGPRRAVGGVDLFAITTQVSEGMPVVNDRGHVIGIAHGNGMVVPSHSISDILEQKRVLSFADMLRETHLTPQVSER